MASAEALGQCSPMLVGQSRYRDTSQDCAVKCNRAVEFVQVSSWLPTACANGKYSSNLRGGTNDTNMRDFRSGHRETVDGNANNCVYHTID